METYFEPKLINAYEDACESYNHIFGITYFEVRYLTRTEKTRICYIDENVNINLFNTILNEKLKILDEYNKKIKKERNEYEKLKKYYNNFKLDFENNPMESALYVCSKHIRTTKMESICTPYDEKEKNKYLTEISINFFNIGDFLKYERIAVGTDHQARKMIYHSQQLLDRFDLSNKALYFNIGDYIKTIQF